ncbi:hypothetical protein ACOT81_25180 [Streptomyces sp. WI04-05B]|uniref:hypothetical protein n=1 Tax=Streptomyces TaxID=1883 RepID=UPI0029B7049F|nr:MULTISPECIES: hypothetical protein [unclassified Streptomyces]MDX2548938.1 hypothetical protein [Streptomyces sp. WI04-05B]MDX2590569.1 hypothetical protein [Streptomyces sp. WI04-05A]MDX3750694.1 hypothetical protein [Streptomyces sp. AK08-02]
MSLQVLGALCIAVAIIGGGLKINEVEIPRMSQRRMAALIFAGFLFLGTDLAIGQVMESAPPTAQGSTSIER